jgi:hypothetical protein
LEWIREEMRLNPGITELIKTAETANPFQLADRILQILKTGGVHDKKN